MASIVNVNNYLREEIPGIINDYKAATMYAFDADFDCIKLPGTNGCLLDQFLRDGSNIRMDEYGGGEHVVTIIRISLR